MTIKTKLPDIARMRSDSMNSSLVSKREAVRASLG
jgi:hypothetical protein